VPKDKEYKGKRTDLRCPLCSSPMVLQDAKFGPFYRCGAYPRCLEKVGADKDSGAPLGMPVKKTTQEIRTQAQEMFDLFWKYHDSRADRECAKNTAILWLVAAAGFPEFDGSVRRLDVNACRQVIALCGKRLQKERKLAKKK